MNILAVFAHPDDETLGCGATLARCADAGARVVVVVFTDGIGARASSDPEGWSAAAARNRNFLAALKVLHLDSGGGFGAFSDQQLDRESSLRLVRTVEGYVGYHKPDVIYTHHVGDLNADHRAVAQAVLTATRPAVSTVLAVYACEIPSSTEWAFGGTPFVPNVFVDVTETIDRKIEAMCCYTNEMGSALHPRSPEKLRALAAWRGATIGAAYAEAFVSLREVRR